MKVVSDVQDTVSSLQALQAHLQTLNQQLQPLPGQGTGGVAGWEKGAEPTVKGVIKLVEEARELDHAQSYLTWLSHISCLRYVNIYT